jgi:hypothetical protein
VSLLFRGCVTRTINAFNKTYQTGFRHSVYLKAFTYTMGNTFSWELGNKYNVPFEIDFINFKMIDKR